MGRREAMAPVPVAGRLDRAGGERPLGLLDVAVLGRDDLLDGDHGGRMIPGISEQLALPAITGRRRRLALLPRQGVRML